MWICTVYVHPIPQKHPSPASRAKDNNGVGLTYRKNLCFYFYRNMLFLLKNLCFTAQICDLLLGQEQLRSLMFYLDAFQSWRKTPEITGRKINWDKGTVPRNASKIQGYQKMCNRSQLHQYRDLCCSVSHTYPAPLYYLHMLGMSGIHPLESPSGNPPLQTAQTATASSKLAEDMHVRYRSFSANYICEYPSQTRFQIWTNSKSCPWKHCDNKPISSWASGCACWLTEEDQMKNLSQDSPDKNFTGPERASNPRSSHKTKDNRHRDLIFLKRAPDCHVKVWC